MRSMLLWLAGVVTAVGCTIVQPAAQVAAPAPQAPCVQVLEDCNPGSNVLETFCGLGTHRLRPENTTKASFIVLRGGITRVDLQHCPDGGPLSAQILSVAADANLCEQPGGCCQAGNRWNDEVCAVTLF
jgi:hypothetical protein